jgi:hypothetical protein
MNQVKIKLTNKNSEKKWNESKKLVKKTVGKVLVLKYLENIIKNQTLNLNKFKKVMKPKNKFVDFYKNQSFSRTLINKICNVLLKLLKH